MANKDFEIKVGYCFGLVSILYSFITPLLGLIAGIIGLIQIKGLKTELSQKAKKLNIIGIVLSIVLFILGIILAIYMQKNFGSIPSFPIA